MLLKRRLFCWHEISTILLLRRYLINSMSTAAAAAAVAVHIVHNVLRQMRVFQVQGEGMTKKKKKLRLLNIIMQHTERNISIGHRMMCIW